MSVHAIDLAKDILGEDMLMSFRSIPNVLHMKIILRPPLGIQQVYHQPH